MPTSLQTIESIGNNREYLNGLIDQLREGPGVTPFVGAGISAQLDLLDWGDFLKSIGRRFGAASEIETLVSSGRYEEAAERCIEVGGPGGLQHSISEEFGDKKLEESKRTSEALQLIPELTKGPVITTNFDHVLERTFRGARKEFKNVRWGSKASAMIEAFQRNHRELFKIHGDVDSPDDRILTREEYNRHYGEPGAQEKRRFPLHRVIFQALSNRPLLFLGCSLKSDRIVGFLKEFYEESQRLAHYAIVWRPKDEDGFNQRVKDLTRLGLKPIWYPYGQHDAIGTILEHVLVRGRGKKPLKRKTVSALAAPTPAQEAAVRQKYDALATFQPAPSLNLHGLDSTAIAKGELVLFLGWGAHLPRERTSNSPPTWRQVAEELANATGYDEGINSITDFTRLTQFMFESGEIQFEDHMRRVLGRAYAPTLAHWFVAGLPALLRSKNYRGVAPLVLTTNQDDVLERAFEEAGEPLETLSYIARGPYQGQFFYRPATGSPLMLRSSRHMAQITVGERPLLVKLHGSIDPRNPEAEKLVLTEDDYLSYLARASASDVLPPAIKQRLIQSSILFIGYSLADWTVRVLLKQIWAKQQPRKVSCAILLKVGKVTKTLLEKQGVRVIDDSWENVLGGLVQALRALPEAGDAGGLAADN